jgi:signal transduction histidine kinase
VDANDKLSKLNEQQAAFVSNVAHEFRSPLAVMKGAMDNLADGLHGPITADQLEPVEMCRREASRLKRLVSDLLDLTRMEAGKTQLRRQPVVLQELLRAVAKMFEVLAKERGLELKVELPPRPVAVLGDADRLEQVFINLLANAVKFTRQGSVTLRLVVSDEAARVEVADTGAGIDPADLGRIFDKFERVGSQTEEGSGLGLPIAKDIIELHGGAIQVESRPGSGSRFTVVLPTQQAA